MSARRNGTRTLGACSGPRPFGVRAIGVRHLHEVVRPYRRDVTLSPTMALLYTIFGERALDGSEGEEGYPGEAVTWPSERSRPCQSAQQELRPGGKDKSSLVIFCDRLAKSPLRPEDLDL